MIDLKIAGYRLISLSGGGFRAALFNAGALRALYFAGVLYAPKLIVNSVSGGAIAAALWRRYLASNPTRKPYWPESALLDLVSRTPRFGCRLNWQVRGAWFRSTRVWQSFLESWWASLDGLPQGMGNNPQFLIEALDYQSGRLWLFDQGRFSPATRELLVTRSGNIGVPVSEMTAVATATAFPFLFQGLKFGSAEDPSYAAHLQDAGLIDNLAMIPLLEILRVDSSHKPFDSVKQWILSDAGKPLAVTSLTASQEAAGNTQIVRRLGLADWIFRLTGDLAQPQFVNLTARLLSHYAKVDLVAVAIGLSLEGEERWVAMCPGDPMPSELRTTLGYLPRCVALGVMGEGAQVMSKALMGAGLMTSHERDLVREFFDGFIRGKNVRVSSESMG